MNDYLRCVNCDDPICVGKDGKYIHEFSEYSCETAQPPCKRHKYRNRSWSDIYGSESIRECEVCGKILWHKEYGRHD